MYIFLNLYPDCSIRSLVCTVFFKLFSLRKKLSVVKCFATKRNQAYSISDGTTFANSSKETSFVEAADHDPLESSRCDSQSPKLHTPEPVYEDLDCNQN